MFDEDVSFTGFAILYILGALMWTFLASFWIGKGVEIGWMMRILVYVLLVPVTYLIAYTIASKD